MNRLTADGLPGLTGHIVIITGANSDLGLAWPPGCSFSCRGTGRAPSAGIAVSFCRDV